jgi:SAM-dependent methyltransferase
VPDSSTQYVTDRNLVARQRLWDHQDPPFDVVAWTLDLAGVTPSTPVVDVGCGNGHYLAGVRDRGAWVVGLDLSIGMLTAAQTSLSISPAMVAADAAALPFPDRTFGVVLAPHMLYHVPARRAAAAEFRRVLVPGGVCVAVTNGARHIASLRALVHEAVRQDSPDWVMMDWAVQAFSLENGGEALESAFDEVRCVRPDAGRVVIRDASVVADYVASVGDHYGPEVERPWPEVVEEVRRSAQRVIDTEGAFVTAGDVGAFVCR